MVSVDSFWSERSLCTSVMRAAVEHGRRERWVVVRGMQVRMRALVQVVVAWACGGDGASARTADEALPGWARLTWADVGGHVEHGVCGISGDAAEYGE